MMLYEVKRQAHRGFLALEGRSRGNPLRKLLGAAVRKLSPGFDTWDWYTDRLGSLAKVEVLGRTMYLDLHDKGVARPIFANRVHEPAETDFLLRTLKPGMTFVDVGANIGYFTLLASDAVGDRGKVIAFEPEPHNLAILRQNIAANEMTNVVVVDQAVSDGPDPLEMFLSEENYGDHRTYRGKDPSDANRAAISVQAVSLDEYVGRHGLRVDVIKMDIQGAELAALRGMASTLAANEDIVIVTEFWPPGLRHSIGDPKILLDELSGMGLRLYEFAGDSGLAETTVDRIWAETKDMTGDEHTDLVVTRKDLSAES